MKQRTITALIALAIFLPFVIFGGLPFTIFVYVLASVGLVELIRMRNIGSYFVPYLLAVLLLWLILIPSSSILLTISWFSKFEMIALIILLLLAYTVLVKNQFTFDQVGFILLACFYVGLGFYYLLETRDGNQALSNILYAFFIIWSTDTGAYLFGRAFGKRKLWPTISPNKTIEGALGGIVLACTVAIIFHLVEPFRHSMLTVVGVTILASIFGQVGDLVESALKRNYGVKDSGKILPGHGGILDRFDSMLFVIPLLHFIHFV
ncbi:phosphatidate cytidylyltransferase [Oceanobacillus profundus]|uniref:Phosphatidate cytidylyltransferase n=1 Tax=Oceanobacillus profundus TaxID=372463 RepID=A0A417YK72_9BACI|nr:phosphatidate cytidylyltransferase [Oceanobacillus profundus]MBR3121548.1 phosphatidate cytidylyltransferase [Oceanobacillus sp.]PAE30062.1 phosphatidate cytidylyltransferase [Paenibacillus sp. 7884-2]MCM3396384.1 phosphatidate cytidylyltransferase [Oceanobacillus profundus]MDO6449606.1 phosphatidate cytidylyltransferase [Oceanobacillus profundus]RHW33611.1 phosphatidate cytidylyltransferase [Oceanobacillus profundus]